MAEPGSGGTKRDHSELDEELENREAKQLRGETVPLQGEEGAAQGSEPSPDDSRGGGPSGDAVGGDGDLDLDTIMPRGESPAWLYVGGGEKGDVKVFDRARCSSTGSRESPQHLLDPQRGAAERPAFVTLIDARRK